MSGFLGRLFREKKPKKNGIQAAPTSPKKEPAQEIEFLQALENYATATATDSPAKLASQQLMTAGIKVCEKATNSDSCDQAAQILITAQARYKDNDDLSTIIHGFITKFLNNNRLSEAATTTSEHPSIYYRTLERLSKCLALLSVKSSLKSEEEKYKEVAAALLAIPKTSEQNQGELELFKQSLANILTSHDITMLFNALEQSSDQNKNVAINRLKDIQIIQMDNLTSNLITLRNNPSVALSQTGEPISREKLKAEVQAYLDIPFTSGKRKPVQDSLKAAFNAIFSPEIIAPAEPSGTVALVNSSSSESGRASSTSSESAAPLAAPSHRPQPPKPRGAEQPEPEVIDIFAQGTLFGAADQYVKAISSVNNTCYALSQIRIIQETLSSKLSEQQKLEPSPTTSDPSPSETDVEKRRQKLDQEIRTLREELKNLQNNLPTDTEKLPKTLDEVITARKALIAFVKDLGTPLTREELVILTGVMRQEINMRKNLKHSTNYDGNEITFDQKELLISLDRQSQASDQAFANEMLDFLRDLKTITAAGDIKDLDRLIEEMPNFFNKPYSVSGKKDLAMINSALQALQGSSIPADSIDAIKQALMLNLPDTASAATKESQRQVAEKFNQLVKARSLPDSLTNDPDFVKLTERALYLAEPIVYERITRFLSPGERPDLVKARPDPVYAVLDFSDYNLDKIRANLKNAQTIITELGSGEIYANRTIQLEQLQNQLLASLKQVKDVNPELQGQLYQEIAELLTRTAILAKAPESSPIYAGLVEALSSGYTQDELQQSTSAIQGQQKQDTVSKLLHRCTYHAMYANMLSETMAQAQEPAKFAELIESLAKIMPAKEVEGGVSAKDPESYSALIAAMSQSMTLDQLEKLLDAAKGKYASAQNETAPDREHVHSYDLLRIMIREAQTLRMNNRANELNQASDKSKLKVLASIKAELTESVDSNYQKSMQKGGDSGREKKMRDAHAALTQAIRIAEPRSETPRPPSRQASAGPGGSPIARSRSSGQQAAQPGSDLSSTA